MSGGGGDIYSPSKADLANNSSNFNNVINQNLQATQGYAPAVSQSAQNLTSNFINNPYQGYAQQGANIASQYGTGTVAPQEGAAGQNLYRLGAQNSQYVPQALATGFSDNNALYNQQFGKTIDQANAINAMSGVGQTPYGAGLTDLAAQNFNNNWNINQANLQSQAANTAGQLTGTAGTAFNTGAELGTNALNTFNTAAGLPASTYGTNLQNDLAALSGQNAAVAGATNINDASANQILNYLNYGTNAGVQKQQQENSFWSGLGSLFGQVGSAAAPFIFS